MMSNSSNMNAAAVGMHDNPTLSRFESNKGNEANENSAAPPAVDTGPHKNEHIQLSDAISSLENSFNNVIRFEIDSELDSVIVKVVDKESGDVIRQIPSEELIELSKKIKEHEWHILDVMA